MHIIGVRKFSCTYQMVKDVDFFQLKRSYNPFNKSEHITFTCCTGCIVESLSMNVQRTDLYHIRHLSRWRRIHHQRCRLSAGSTNTMSIFSRLNKHLTRHVRRCCRFPELTRRAEIHRTDLGIARDQQVAKLIGDVVKTRVFPRVMEVV